jgi:ACT domain-containing protein
MRGWYTTRAAIIAALVEKKYLETIDELDAKQNAELDARPQKNNKSDAIVTINDEIKEAINEMFS